MTHRFRLERQSRGGPSGVESCMCELAKGTRPPADGHTASGRMARQLRNDHACRLRSSTTADRAIIEKPKVRTQSTSWHLHSLKA